MKTKFLLGACALAACFVGCQNDEYLIEQATENGSAESGEVIGADLVSKGMNIALSEEGPSTRVNASGWEVGDQLGLAWYRFSSTAIDQPQSESTWNNGTWNYNFNTIYANHIFSWDGTTFGTVADVYQGAYFVYFPYERLGGAIVKEVDVNAEPQKGTFEEERYNKALHLSAQDFISANEAVDENNKLTKEFYMSPVVNVLGVKATPGEEIANATGDGEYLKGMTITQMQLTANGNVFQNAGTLVPSRIPKVVRNRDNSINYEDTREAMDNAAKTATSGRNAILTNVATASSKLTTTVENPDYTLANVREVRAFAFPIQNGVTYSNDRTNPSATITVGRLNEDGTLNYALGTFTINVTNSEAFITKLRNALDATKTDDAISLTKILRDSDGDWSALRTDMVANLKLANFAPATTAIRTLDQWNDLVKLYDALVAVQGAENVAEPTFNITANITFDGAIATPKNKDFNINVTTSSANVKMIIEGETEWPANLTAVRTSNRAANIEVAEDAVLKFNPEAGTNGAGKALDANITNKGIIEAGAYASIGTQTNAALNNAEGRVVVEYGAYVYPAVSHEGEIAYEVEDANPTTIGNINTLITKTSEATQKGYAQVNTLVVSTTLDLNARATEGSDNRYETVNGTTLAALTNVAIELNGGIIEKVLAGTNNTVASITAVGGDNTTTEVKTTTITVKAGKLTIESTAEKDEDKWLEDVETITNYGTITFNTNGEVKDVYNYKQINVNAPYTVTYSSLEQQNPAGGTGNFSGNLKPATVYTPDETELTAATKAVQDAWSDLNFTSVSDKTLAGFAKYVRDNASSGNSPKTDAFIAALNKWFEVYYGDNSHNVSKDTLEEQDLRDFENATNTRFSFV